MRKYPYHILIVCFVLTIMGCTQNNNMDANKFEPVDYVNQKIGGISHLLVPTFPTVHLPNSMLRVYPERSDFTGDLLKGLPLIVTSHRGSSAFNLSPFQGQDEDLKPIGNFSYDLEKITPYSYSVYLDELMTQVHYAVSHQSGLYKLDFSINDAISLVVNSRNGQMEWNGNAVLGHQNLQNNTKVYIYLESDIPPQKVGILENNKFLEQDYNTSGDNAALVLKYPVNTTIINIRYGISFISTDQAKKNLEREIKAYNMNEMLGYGRDQWNNVLGKTKVKGGSMDDQTIFYTSLYRTYERPVCISEDGQYFSAFDGKIHDDEGTPFYTDDWIWDTYRATHPLRVITESKMETDIIVSFIRMAEQMENFWMPTFPEITGDSRRMNSNHAVATVADAYAKGLTGFDLDKAYQACKNAITEKTLAPWSGSPAGELDFFFKENGYIPALREGEPETIPEVHSFERRQPVAVTLGTVYDEWCLAQIAKLLGNREDYNYFINRSLNYRKLFHTVTHFFHPRDSKGEFIQPFSYEYSGGQGARGYYGENNGWIYRWDVPHNIADLIDLMGGNESFSKKLDSMFSKPLGKSKFEFYSQLPDHTGNVGQFSMANEPSLHIPYLYNYAGKPWKTQKRVSSLLDLWFRNDLMGVPGDEDGGGMSAFVVFSMMGFYPVTPGMPMYVIGTPSFESTEIDLGNNRKFKIMAENFSEENKYIQSATLNGSIWNKSWFSHDDLINGGTLKLIMGSKANPLWASDSESVPPSFTLGAN